MTQHKFYRYDKLCNGSGKFSHKMVKIVAYQKADHREYLEREKDRLAYEAQLEKERLEGIAKKQKEKEGKLNA